MRRKELGIPALLNITSSPPNRPTAKSTSACTSSASETSARWNAASSPSFAASSSPCSWSTSAMTTCAPSPTNSSAVARPIPLAPPVTIATFPDSSWPMSDLLDPVVDARVHPVCREDGVDLREVVVVDRPPQRADVVLHLGDGAAPDERRADTGPRRRPAERELGHAAAVPRRDRDQVTGGGDVPRHGTGPEEVPEQWCHHTPLVGLRPPVVGRELHPGREGARQQPVGQRAVGHEADALVLAVRQHGVLHAAVEQAQPVLHDVDPPRLLARRQLVAGEVRHTDEPCLAVAHNLVERAHRLVEGDRAVGPVHQQHVDVVGAEVAQTQFDRRPHALAAAVTEVRPVGVPDAELGDEHHLVAPGSQRPAQRLLGGPVSVPRRSVEAVDAEVDRPAHGVSELGLVDGPVPASDLLAAEADGRHLEARRPERSMLHHVPRTPRPRYARRQRTGRCLIPPFTAELSRSTGPDTSKDESLVSRCRKTVSISRRARCAPMQKCSPNPKASCGFGRRSMRNANGSPKTSSSRFPDAKNSARCSPSRISTPRTSASSVAMRVKWMMGLPQRRISSTAWGRSWGWSRSRCHSPRCSENASSPPLIAFLVVSLPASTISSQYESSCTSVRGSPSISAASSSVTRSSPGSERRRSISSPR